MSQNKENHQLHVEDIVSQNSQCHRDDKFKVHLYQYPGGGDSYYKSDGGDHWKF